MVDTRHCSLTSRKGEHVEARRAPQVSLVQRRKLMKAGDLHALAPLLNEASEFLSVFWCFLELVFASSLSSISHVLSQSLENCP
jgi:hypothetical protein